MTARGLICLASRYGPHCRHAERFKPGDKVELTFMRDGVEKTTEATLAEHKSSTVAAKAENADTAQNEAAPALGVTLARANRAGTGHPSD